MNELKKQFPVLEHTALGGGEHYLDSAATALMPRAVLEAARRYDETTRGNVGRAVHRFGEAATEAFEAARAAVAAGLRTAAEQVVFTAGATAGLDLLARGLTAGLGAGDCVLLSVAEHHSNIVPWQIAAAQRGFSLRFFGVGADGAADAADAVAAIARYRPRVVAAAHRTNVGGGAADIAKIAAAARDAGAVLVADGAQYAPHGLPAVDELGADFYVFSGHKVYAPNGVGVLWGRSWADFPAVVGGGGAVLRVTKDGFEQRPPPHCLEAGTPPVTPAVGLAAAVEWMRGLPPAATQKPAGLARQLRDGLAAMKKIRLLFPAAEPSAPLVSFLVEGAHPHDVCEWLAARGVFVRGGEMCAAPLFAQLGLAAGCVRASFAPYNDEADVHSLLEAVEGAAEKLTK